MKDKTVNILISGEEGPKFHLYREALEYSGVNVTDGYLPEYRDLYDGLLLAGGSDISPYLYGESDNGSVNCNPLRDECEYKLIEKFVKAKKPIFGICRGMQILNVYFGGTLISDLPPFPKHRISDGVAYHKVNLEHNSLMGRLFKSELTVNSFHHQAIRDIAKGFKATAYSCGDGVIEAVEHIENPWFAVQFHPERMLSGDVPADNAKPLFDYFITLCQNKSLSFPVF